MTLYASKAEMLGDAVCTAFKKAGIKVVLNHYPLGENECIVDTTEHDKEVRNKTIEEFFRRLNLKFIESPLDDFVVRDILGEIKKIAMQMKEGAENG